ILYPHAYRHQSPVPLVYDHPTTPTYGFGFSFYDDMSPFTGILFEEFLFQLKLFTFIE
ncbi:unnamed protein product, partial [Rotaria magnacalcarata]